ncbi:KilA-N domain-containing protein [Pseudomonas sp. S 311-6]|nr:DNA-binding protein [Bordetella sp. J329]MCO7642522.1 KilA-N domain-containing protein [Pseudomonas sp. S 311-6]
MAKTDKTLQVQGVEISITTKEDQDYISLTDMTSAFQGGDQLIKNWLQNKNTIDFLGVWETLNNQNFNLVEFHQIKTEAGLNRFVMSAKRWVERTGGIGLVARTGRYGGTFAHKDIAFEFGSWLSPEFKLYLIKEFQRLKDAEIQSGQLEWNIRRTLAKAQYRVHTDAIRDHLIPAQVSKKQQGYVYASEADLLNQALFGMTAKDWTTSNPDLAGNIRDHATVEQLVVLSSLESQNALLIQQGMPQGQRLVLLNQLARQQLQSLIDSASVRRLGGAPDLLN